MVKEAQKKAVQEVIEKVKLGDAELEIVLHFKYLGVMQSRDSDPLVAVNHRIAVAWSRYADLKRLPTASRLPKGLRLRLLHASLLYGCDSWKLSKASPTKAKRHSVKDAIKNYWTDYRR